MEPEEEYLFPGGSTTSTAVIPRVLRYGARTVRSLLLMPVREFRQPGNDLIKEQRSTYNIIFTHSHWDHIVGFPFFKPFYSKETTINLMGCPVARGSLKKLLSKAMDPPYFPVPFDKLKATVNYFGDCPPSFRTDSVEIFGTNLSHPNVGLAYKFVEDGKTFVFLTDNELGYRHREGPDFEGYAELARNADLMIHDAEYTPKQYKMTKTWRHSIYLDALNLAFKAKTELLGLFHHNQYRNDDDQDAIVQRCMEII